MNYSIQSIIDNSHMRDNAVAELCKAIDELDVTALERVLTYAVDRREAFLYGDPRIKLVDEPLSDLEKTKDIPLVLGGFEDRGVREAKELTETTKRAIARAEKAVRTRKRNAKTRKVNTKKAATKQKKTANATKPQLIVEYLIANSAGLSAVAVAKALGMNDHNVSSYLSAAKKAHLIYNEKSLWYPSRRAMNSHKLAKRAIAKLANGATTSP